MIKPVLSSAFVIYLSFFPQKQQRRQRVTEKQVKLGRQPGVGGHLRPYEGKAPRDGRDQQQPLVKGLRRLSFLFQFSSSMTSAAGRPDGSFRGTTDSVYPIGPSRVNSAVARRAPAAYYIPEPPKPRARSNCKGQVSLCSGEDIPAAAAALAADAAPSPSRG